MGAEFRHGPAFQPGEVAFPCLNGLAQTFQQAVQARRFGSFQRGKKAIA